MFVSLYTLCWFTQLPPKDSCKGTVLQICINWWVSHDLLSRWGQYSRHGELLLVTVNPIQKLQEPNEMGTHKTPSTFPATCQDRAASSRLCSSHIGTVWVMVFSLTRDQYDLAASHFDRLIHIDLIGHLCRTELTNNIHLGNGRGLLGVKPLVPFCHKTFKACCHFTWGSLFSESETPVKRCSS